MQLLELHCCGKASAAGCHSWSTRLYAKYFLWLNKCFSPMNSRCSLNCLNIPTEKKRAWLRKRLSSFSFFFPPYFSDKDSLYPPPLLLVSLTEDVYKNKTGTKLKLGLLDALFKGCMDCDLLNFKSSRVKAKKETDFYAKMLRMFSKFYQNFFSVAVWTVMYRSIAGKWEGTCPYMK